MRNPLVAACFSVYGPGFSGDMPVPMMPSATLREGQAYAEVLTAQLAEEYVAERERAVGQRGRQRAILRRRTWQAW